MEVIIDVNVRAPRGKGSANAIVLKSTGIARGAIIEKIRWRVHMMMFVIACSLRTALLLLPSSFFRDDRSTRCSFLHHIAFPLGIRCSASRKVEYNAKSTVPTSKAQGVPLQPILCSDNSARDKFTQ